MGNLSQPQEKKAKLEGEDEAKLGTETSSNDVIERGDVNQERSVSELQMSVAKTEKEKPKQLLIKEPGHGDAEEANGVMKHVGEPGVRAFVPLDSKEGIIEHLLRSQEDIVSPGKGQVQGSLEVKAEMMVKSQGAALAKTEDVEVVTIIKSEKMAGARNLETPILGSMTSNLGITTDKEGTAFQEKDGIVIEDGEDEIPSVSPDILQPVAVLDGQSIARGTKFLYLSPEEKLARALDYFEKRGFKVVIFLPKTEVEKKGRGPVKDASAKVKDSVKVTIKKLPRTSDNAWGLDKWEVVQYAVNNEALLVTNDNYKNLTFENGAFKEQIDKRLVGYKWKGEDFTMSYERKTEAWFPNINSINWKPQKKSSVSERQREITEMEARLDDLTAYERQRLTNIKELEDEEQDK